MQFTNVKNVNNTQVNTAFENFRNTLHYRLISNNIVQTKYSSEYETNTDRNIFLKKYLETKAGNEGVKIPAGMKINISSCKFDNKCKNILRGLENKKYWADTINRWKGKSSQNKSIEQYCIEKGLSEPEKKQVLDLYRFHDVRVNIFGARIADMFKLLAQDSKIVAEKTRQMKISGSDKEKILQLKNFFDKYYKVEAEYDGKKIDLLHPTEESMNELRNISPEFAKFIENEQPELLKHTIYFAQQEMKAEELSEAGRDSRAAAAVLATILTGNVAKGMYDAKKVNEGLRRSQAFTKYVKDPKNRQVLDNLVKKYLKSGAEQGMEVIKKDLKKLGFEGGEHLVEQAAIFKKGMPKFINPIKAFKGAAGAALIGLILTSLQGSADDCMGACKDYVQDQNNFGTKTALGIGILSIAAGVLSSMAIAPTLEAMVTYNRAERTMLKNGLAKAPKMGIFKKIGKIGIPGALFGMLVASSSSGSSWASMLLTRLKLGLNGRKLKNKNIISKEEDTFNNSNKNMLEYEAYNGKWNGITKGDWSIGATGGALGLFTHTNPYIQSFSFGLQGCSETLTACGYQLLGNKVRENQIEKDKKQLVTSLITSKS